MKVTGQVETAACQAIIDQAATIMQTLAVRGHDHPLSQKAAAGLARTLNEARPPYALQFVAGGLFRNRVVVPVDIEKYNKVRQVSRSMHNLSIHELGVERAVSAEGAMALGRMLAAGVAGPAELPADYTIPGVRWRTIPGFQPGHDSKTIDPSHFAVTQVVWAAEEAARIDVSLDSPWPWDAGINIVRRLERALLVSEINAKRAVELLPGDWTPARRAIAACMLALNVLERLNVDRISRRSAAHALFALAMQGLNSRGGLELPGAAGIVRERLMEGIGSTVGGIDPHRLRTSAIVHFFARSQTREEGPLGVLRLIHLAYFMERARRPSDVPLSLSPADMMAYAVRFAGETFDPLWVRTVSWAIGVTPIGSPVKLQDGRVGVVVGPAPEDEPWRPTVSVDGESFRPTNGVTLALVSER